MTEEIPVQQRPNPLAPEVYLSYMGGVNAFAQNHREMGDSTLRHLVNGTVRGGWVQTRPAFKWIETTFENATDKETFEQGKVQGSCYYRHSDGAYIVYAVDGNLFGFDPITGRVANLNPSGERPFSKYADFVYFSPRSGYLISGDGMGRQVITHGYESRYARPENNEVPISLMMADSWGRLAVVMPDRKRIKFSNHEMDPDPTYGPLGFDEGTDYYLNSRYFQVPNHIGKIVWIGFLSQLNTDTGTGPLIVIGEHGTQYYDVSVPRSQWSTQDISGALLPHIGGIAHRAQCIRNDELIFSDQNGRIRILKNALRDEKTLTVKRFDRHVYPYYERETADLRRWRMAVNWNERVLVSVQPESRWIPGGDVNDRFRVRHRGIVAWNGEVTELSDENDTSVWDGLWTGIYPTALDVGSFSVSNTIGGKELCVALSHDNDGINRPYEIAADGAGRYDIGPSATGEAERKQIEMQLITRQFDFSGDGDFSLLLKRLDRGVIRVGERYGKTRFRGYVQSDQEWLARPWFDHRTNADQSLQFETVRVRKEKDCGQPCEVEECRLTTGQPHYDPKLQLPSDQAEGFDAALCTSLKHFYKSAIHLIVNGWARIEEMMFSADERTEPHTQTTTCECEPEAKRSTGCNPQIWRYSTADARAAECETTTTTNCN